MADLLLGNIKPAGDDKVVVDSKYVKGGYVVAATLAELFPENDNEINASLKGADGKNIVEGSLCYCQENKKFYIYAKDTKTNTEGWVEKTFGASITVDSSLNSESLNPVQNKVIKAALDEVKKDTTHGIHVPDNGTTGQVLKKTADGVAWETDNNTEYTTATSDKEGLVKIGYTENGKNYPVELADGKMFVNVPWTDNNTVYEHPASGVAEGSYTKVTVDVNGHVTSGSNPTTLSGYGIEDAYTKEEFYTKLNVFEESVERQLNNFIPKNDLDDFIKNTTKDSLTEFKNELGITLNSLFDYDMYSGTLDIRTDILD